MKVAVLGLGRIGHSYAARLANRGFEVCGFTRDPEKTKVVNEHGITVSGAITGNFKVKATTDIKEAIDGAAFIIVTSVSKGHKPIAEMLKGNLQEGQIIAIMTGNWGAYEMYGVLRDEVKEKCIVIGETSGNIASSPTLTYPATVFIKPPKDNMSFATIPAAKAPETVKALKDVMPELYPVKNILDTSMNNPNPPVHVPLSIFNITRIANGEDALLFGECMPQFILDFVMGADAERCAVIKAMGGKPLTILEIMNGVWNVDYDNLKELGMNNKSLHTTKIPKTPYHRFLLEDVPYGYLPVSKLGKVYGVPTPRIDILIGAYKYLFGDKAEMEGPAFDIDISEVI